MAPGQCVKLEIRTVCLRCQVVPAGWRGMEFEVTGSQNLVPALVGSRDVQEFPIRARDLLPQPFFLQTTPHGRIALLNIIRVDQKMAAPAVDGMQVTFTTGRDDDMQIDHDAAEEQRLKDDIDQLQMLHIKVCTCRTLFWPQVMVSNSS